MSLMSLLNSKRQMIKKMKESYQGKVVLKIIQ